MNKNLFLIALKKTMVSNNHTQIDLGNATNIGQSQISKILNGEFSRKGTAIDKLMKYSNYYEYKEFEMTSSEINKAVAEVWDGSKRMEMQIAKIIREIGVVWQL